MKKNIAFKKIVLAGLAVLFLVLLSGAWAKAEDSRRKEALVSKNEVINGDYLNAAEAVDVAGTVNGDAMVAGGTINFSGKTLGDILATGGSVNISGENEGNARVVGGNVSMGGRTSKNVTVVGGDVVIEKGSVIEGNLYAVGGSVEIRGEVKGNAKVAGGRIFLAGHIGKNAEIMSDEISLGPDAKIKGNLTYLSDKNMALEKSAVAGEIVRKPMPFDFKEKKSAAGFVLSKIMEFLGLLILAFVLYRLFFKRAEEVFKFLLEKDPWRNIAFGLVIAILIPILFIILAVTFIGLPLALIIIFAFIAAMIAAKLIAFTMAGYLVNKKFKAYEFTEKFPFANFAVGFVAVEILRLIPVLGWIAIILLYLWAFGGLVGYVRANLSKGKA